MVAAILGLVGLSVVGLASWQTVTYWHTVHAVSIKDYAMMMYYGMLGVYGMMCVCC